MRSISSFLTEIFHSRQARNQAYSLRAFARDWGVSPGRVSEILSGKRNLTLKMKILLEKNLNLNGEQIETLNDLMHTQSGLRPPAPVKKYISAQDFMSINSWSYYAVLSLFESYPHLNDHAELSKKLGLEVSQVDEVIATLLRLNLIERDNGRYTPKNLHTTTDQDKINFAIQNFHSGLIKKHLEVMQNCSVEEREVQALIFNMNPQSLPKAKKILRRCLVQLEKECPPQDKSSEVFALSVFLSPLTKRISL